MDIGVGQILSAGTEAGIELPSGEVRPVQPEEDLTDEERAERLVRSVQGICAEDKIPWHIFISAAVEALREEGGGITVRATRPRDVYEFLMRRNRELVEFLDQNEAACQTLITIIRMWAQFCKERGMPWGWFKPGTPVVTIGTIPKTLIPLEDRKLDPGEDYEDYFAVPMEG